MQHLLKDLKRNEKELKKHFNKATAHLDRKDSVSDYTSFFIKLVL
jgi:hypothetical protein